MRKFNKIIASLIILCLLAPSLWADNNIFLVTNEAWSEQIVLRGSADKPVVIFPPSRFKLSSTTRKVIVLPEELDLKEEYSQFRLFRNRYVIFGVYLFLSLYYNWLTRSRR